MINDQGRREVCVGYFEQASKIARSRQEKIAAVLEAFVNQHSDRKA
ncbi:MAG: hypothetical protein ACREAB_21615 [Blastocatellia bacterium]